MDKKYSGFTLIEMLIVMGIIIILMAVGIAAGRFAINRANDVAHQNAADQLFTAVTSHLTDTREYPSLDLGFGTALADGGALNDYLSEGEFRGGTDAHFMYWTNSSRGAALVCVSLGGPNDQDGRGHYCTGTGFSSDTTGPGSLAEKDINAGEMIEANWCNVALWRNDLGTGSGGWETDEGAAPGSCNIGYTDSGVV